MPNLLGSNAFREDVDGDEGEGREHSILRPFGSERVALPSARWNEEDALGQQFVLVIVRSHDDP
jgi:hypothetical protein